METESIQGFLTMIQGAVALSILMRQPLFMARIKEMSDNGYETVSMDSGTGIL